MKPTICCSRYLLPGVALFLAVLFLPQAARAEWLEASSANFVVYANDSEKNLRRFSEQLELYHQAMEGLTGLDLPVPSPSNRLTVYIVRNEREVERLYGKGARNVGGFYVPRAGGSMAVVPRVFAQTGAPEESMLVLLHEYAHHFIMSNSSMVTPRWMGEGAAEFFASAEFPPTGGISVGMPAFHRAGELQFARDVPMEQLLDPSAYKDGVRKGFDSFYGKSWALYHYLQLGSEERRGELRRYQLLLAQGMESPAAGLEAFGDLRKLDREIDRYLEQRSMLTVTFRPGQLQIGEIALRELTPGEEAVMPVVVRSRRGVSREQATELLPEVRKIAATHPNEAAVLEALAEAEFDAGEDARAIAAADAALALDPGRVRAYLHKGYALFRQASSATDREAAYAAAVEPFLALNRIESDHPVPLVHFFRSFAERNRRPSEQAVRGMIRAIQLAPFDLNMRLNFARYLISARDLPGLRACLLPVAYHPHGGQRADNARRVIDRIAQGGDPLPRELFALLEGR